MEKKSDSRSCEFSRLLFNFGSKVKTVEETVNWLLKRSPQCLKLVCQTLIDMKIILFLYHHKVQDFGSNQKRFLLEKFKLNNYLLPATHFSSTISLLRLWSEILSLIPRYHKIWYNHFVTSSVFNSCVTLFPHS